MKFAKTKLFVNIDKRNYDGNHLVYIYIYVMSAKDKMLSANVDSVWVNAGLTDHYNEHILQSFFLSPSLYVSINSY